MIWLRLVKSYLLLVSDYLRPHDKLPQLAAKIDTLPISFKLKDSYIGYAASLMLVKNVHKHLYFLHRTKPPLLKSISAMKELADFCSKLRQYPIPDFRKKSNLFTIARCNFELGFLYTELSKFSFPEVQIGAATNHFRQALTIYSNGNYSKQRQKTLLGLAFAHGQLMELEEAIACYNLYLSEIDRSENRLDWAYHRLETAILSLQKSMDEYTTPDYQAARLIEQDVSHAIRKVPLSKASLFLHLKRAYLNQILFSLTLSRSDFDKALSQTLAIKKYATSKKLHDELAKSLLIENLLMRFRGYETGQSKYFDKAKDIIKHGLQICEETSNQPIKVAFANFDMMTSEEQHHLQISPKDRRDKIAEALSIFRQVSIENSNTNLQYNFSGDYPSFSKTINRDGVVPLEDLPDLNEQFALAFGLFEHGKKKEAVDSFKHYQMTVQTWLETYKDKAPYLIYEEALLTYIFSFAKLTGISRSDEDFDYAVKIHSDYLDKPHSEKNLILARISLAKTYVYYGTDILTAKHAETITLNFEALLDLVSLSDTPKYWFEVFVLLAKYHEMGNFNCDYQDRDLLASSVTTLNSFLELGHYYLNSLTNTETRLAVLDNMTGFSDTLCFMLLKLGKYEEAIKALSFGRSITMNKKLIEEELEDSSSLQVTKARIDWLEQVERRENISNAILEEDDHSQSHLDLQECTRKIETSFRQYCQLIDQFSLSNQHQFTLGDLGRAIKPGCVLAVIISTVAYSAAIIIPHGARSLSRKNILWLDDLHGKYYKKLVLNEFGWIAKYKAFKKAVNTSDASAKSEDWANGIEVICNDLGQKIAQPLHDFLSGHDEISDVSEIQFMPTGILSVFPLHATYIEANNKVYHLIEKYAVSYWPNFASVINAQSRHENSRRSGKKLAAVSGDLSMRISREDLTGSDQLTSVIGQRNDKQEAINAIAENNFSFFLGHAHWDEKDVGQSSIFFGNEAITVSEIKKIDLPLANTIFLGGCETGMTELKRTPDEFFGLSTAFLEAGFPCIVSSLWAVDSNDTQRLAQSFFEEVFHSDIRPSLALQKALIQVVQDTKKLDERERVSELIYWTPFIVTGG